MSEVELLLRDYRADLLSGFGVGKEALPAQLQRASRVARIGKALDAAREDAAKRIDEVVGHCPKGPRADEEVAATKNHELWTTLALCLGFNELAKLGKTLGDKVYARLFRDKHVENLIALGGNGGVSPFADEKATVEIEMPAPMPWLRFRASDIELMRAVVAEHDAASPLPDPCENAFSGDDQMQRTNEAGTPKDWRAVLDSLGTTGLQTMGFRPEVIEKLWALREAEKRQQAAEEQPTGGAE
jgi:hypothetical protein